MTGRDHDLDDILAEMTPMSSLLFSLLLARIDLRATKTCAAASNLVQRFFMTTFGQTSKNVIEISACVSMELGGGGGGLVGAVKLVFVLLRLYLWLGQREEQPHFIQP